MDSVSTIDLLKYLVLSLLLFLGSCSSKGVDSRVGDFSNYPPFWESDVEADWSRDGRYIIYLKGDLPDSNWIGGIYLHDTSTGRDSLTYANLWAEQMSFSPDGKKIAFWQGQEIYVSKINGDSLVKVAAGGHSQACRWSPRSNRIAYTDQLAGTFLIDSDGKNKRLVSNRLVNADWFPDGLTLGGRGLGDEIYITDTLGQNLHKITSTGVLKHLVRVSPKGDRILFSQQREIWAVDTNGTNLKRLTTGGDYISWSPDAEWIVYTNGGDNNGHLWLMRPDGTGKHQITF